MVLYHPDGIAPSAPVDTMERTLSDKAFAAGMEVTTADDLGSVEFSPGDLIAALMSPPDELESLGARFPMAHIIGYAESPIPSANLTVIHFDPVLYDKMGFIGGYISAMQSPEWRIGLLTPSDGGSGSEVSAFLNGVTFFCGLCREVNPPYYDYPVVISVNPTNSGATQEAVTTFSQTSVRTVYLPTSMPGSVLEGVSIPAGLGFVSAAPGMSVFDGWVIGVTLDYEAAAERAFTNVEQGGPGTIIPLSVQLADPNHSYISQGRVDHMEQILEDVNSGFIAVQPE